MPWSSWWKRGGAPGPAPKRVASSVEDNWERLVRAVLRRDRAGQGASSVGRLLQVADDIVDDDRNVARILCEHAYRVSLNLDPSNDGIGVLQFRAGLSSVIKQKLAKDTTGSINRQNESGVLWKFYREYIKRCRRVDDVQREQERMRESGTCSTELGTSVEMKNTYATLRVLLDALQILVGEEPTDELGTQILDEVRAATAAFQNFEDNDELSPAQVNDVKAFIEDYCVRNKDGGRGLESVVENWERLVRAVLKQEWAGGASSSAAHATGAIGIASAMAPSLGRITNIEQILQAVADIENDDLNVARILSEQAYVMAQSLDPSSDWRGVLQFKTGLVSVVRQKLAKKGGASIDRQNDIEVLWNFYLEYKGHHRVDEMQREQERKRESGTFSTEMGTRDVEMKMIYATLRGLLNALEILVGKAPSDRLYRQILDEVEALQDMVSPAPSSLIKGIAAVSTTAVLSTKSPTSTSPTQMESTLHHMPLQQLKDITNNFCHELGRGGFGVVYKGLLENGQMVAVKKLLQFKPSSQEQFENEVDLLINLMHPNIVRLVGYCYEMKKSHISHQGKFVFAWNVESLLCLECLTNGSLDKYISDASSILDWPTRCKIIEGVSYGLQYLHEQSDGPIIHLDLKPANILLDENMVPKITDFGLSRLFDQEQTIRTANTSGTLGYMSPEYLRGIITPKADIFSLGVIIMEIITGHREYPYDIRTSSEDFIELEVEKWRNVLQKEQGNTSLETDCQQIKKMPSDRSNMRES